MRKLVIALFVLLITAACSANNNRELGQSDQPQIGTPINQAETNPNEFNWVGYMPWKDRGLNVQKMSANDTSHLQDIIPSEPDAGREEQVLKLVNESEKFIGKKIDNRQFIEQVYTKVGYKGINITTGTPIRNQNAKNIWSQIQPGDIVFFDLNQDGSADHFAIKLGNGDIIHSYTGGKVMITDILKEPKWKQKIISMQRVF